MAAKIQFDFWCFHFNSIKYQLTCEKQRISCKTLNLIVNWEDILHRSPGSIFPLLSLLQFIFNLMPNICFLLKILKISQGLYSNQCEGTVCDYDQELIKSKKQPYFIDYLVTMLSIQSRTCQDLSLTLQNRIMLNSRNHCTTTILCWK